MLNIHISETTLLWLLTSYLILTSFYAFIEHKTFRKKEAPDYDNRVELTPEEFYNAYYKDGKIPKDFVLYMLKYFEEYNYENFKINKLRLNDDLLLIDYADNYFDIFEIWDRIKLINDIKNRCLFLSPSYLDKDGNLYKIWKQNTTDIPAFIRSLIPVPIGTGLFYNRKKISLKKLESLENEFSYKVRTVDNFINFVYNINNKYYCFDISKPIDFYKKR